MFYLAFILLKLIIKTQTAVFATLKCLFPETFMVSFTAVNNQLLDRVYSFLPPNSISFYCESLS